MKRITKISSTVFILATLLTAVVVINTKLPNFVTKSAGKTRDNKINLAQTQQDNKINPTPSASTNITKLQKYFTVEAALLGISDDFSLYFKDVPNGREITFDPTRSWIPASTIKAYVALEAFKQRRLGLISFDQQVTIKKENVVPTELETDDFPRLREGTIATINDLVEAMIIQSDNTAYNTLLDVLDRRNINATLKDIGITETVVGEKLNLDDDQFAVDTNVAGRQSNTTTVKDYATLFDLLYRKQIPDAEEILSIFKRQKINNMIPAYLPQDVVVAHKTGDWAPIYHDGGIVYKTDEPFLLSIFTKGNDPNVLAQLSKVAYYQNADAVGQANAVPQQNKKTSLDTDSPIIYLTQNYDASRVLGESTSEKFPAVTAQDLGITKEDLAVDRQDTVKIADAKILPGSVFYPLKKFWGNLKSAIAFTNDRKIAAQSDLAADRLAEIKTLMKSGRLEETKILLAQSEENLTKAVGMMKDSKATDKYLPHIKQINDLHFAALAEAGKNLNATQKEQFIDMVYDFYEKNKKEVKPAITNSLAANPLKQQPIIGTVKQINDNSVTLQFEGGTEKTVNLDAYTPIRDFHKKTLDSDGNTLKPGSKIAVIGQTTNTGTIIPQFILRDVPKEIPDKKEGVVLQIIPRQNILEILNRKGEREIIKISQDTKITGKDTSVSLLGIKAGSIITVFGEIEKNGSVSTNPSNLNISHAASYSIQLTTPAGKNGPTKSLSPQPTNATTPKTSQPKAAPIPQSPSNPIVINATSITVINNASGKQEKSSGAPSKKSSGVKSGGKK